MNSGEWAVRTTETLCKTPWMRVERETVATPSRPSGVEWVTAFRPTGAVVAPRLPTGEYLLIRQERIPVRREMWEFPAGQVEGECTPAAIEAAARRELGEEAGVACSGPLLSLGPYFTSCGFTDECCHLFLAKDVMPHDDPGPPDALEAIHEVRAFTVAELCSAVGDGRVCDANTLALLGRLAARGLFP